MLEVEHTEQIERALAICHCSIVSRKGKASFQVLYHPEFGNDFGTHEPPVEYTFTMETVASCIKWVRLLQICVEGKGTEFIQRRTVQKKTLAPHLAPIMISDASTKVNFKNYF